MIDLDAYPPSRPRPPRRMPWRRVTLGISAVLLLLLGPAAVPEPGGSLPVAAAAGRRTAAWLLTDKALYTVHRSAETGDDEVVARPLAPGAPQWTRPFRPEPSPPVLTSHGELLFVHAAASGSVTVLDAATGAVRWTTSRDDSAMPAGNRILVLGPEPDTMSLVDPATGRSLWRRTSDMSVGAADVMGAYLLAVGYDGQVTTFSARTGDQVGTATVAEDLVATKIVDSRAYALGPGDVTALRLPGLDALWTVPLAGAAGVDTCGLLICVAAAGGVTALDPGTGAVRWNHPDWVELIDDVAVTRNGHSLEVDLETGKVRSDLGEGRPVGGLMLRADRDAVVWVTDRDTGDLRGSLPHAVPVGCAVAGDYLACPTQDLAVTAWEVRRPRLVPVS